MEDADRNVAHFGIEMVFRLIGRHTQNFMPYVEMKSKAPQDSESPVVLLFPGIEGFGSIYQDFTRLIGARTVAVQLNLDNNQKSIVEMAEFVMPVSRYIFFVSFQKYKFIFQTVKKFLSNKIFAFVAYSYGSLVALEVVSILESLGYHGTLIIIDGSPLLMKQMLLNLDIESERIFETALLCHLLSFYVSFEQIGKHKVITFFNKTTLKI